MNSITELPNSPCTQTLPTRTCLPLSTGYIQLKSSLRDHKLDMGWFVPFTQLHAACDDGDLEQVRQLDAEMRANFGESLNERVYSQFNIFLGNMRILKNLDTCVALPQICDAIRATFPCREA